MEKKLLVFYVGVAGVRSEDIRDFIKKITERITPETFQGEIIIIPTQSMETRVECIDPKYITKKELIDQHTELMKKLHEELHFQLEEIKKEKNA
jgi:hypothetical protein